jgi:hypothetical protein
MQDNKDLEATIEGILPLKSLDLQDLQIIVENASLVKDTPSFRKEVLTYKDLSTLLGIAFGTYQKTDNNGRPKGKPKEIVPIREEGFNENYGVRLHGRIDVQGVVYTGAFDYVKEKHGLKKDGHIPQSDTQSLANRLTFKPVSNSQLSLLVYVPEIPERIYAKIADNASREATRERYMNQKFLELGERIMNLYNKACMFGIAVASKPLFREDHRLAIHDAFNLNEGQIPMMLISLGYEHNTAKS